MIRLTRAQVRQIDRLAVEQYKIPGIVLMENAARAAADVASQMLPDKRGDVLILCGGGNNGGDGLAIARHLHNRGYNLKIALTTDPAKYQNEALANWQIVQAMLLPTGSFDANAKPALILDAIFGTGLSQAPRDPFSDIAKFVAAMNAPILAIDIPSGLDCDTGKPLSACIRATRTITFVAEKAGFAQPSAAEFIGKVTVGDIGCPVELIQQVLTSPPASHPHN
jgi:NAD(P)H-hydrate epimerase